MKMYADYQNCLTNLACSIAKYFEISYSHTTLDVLDEILKKGKYKNIVTILCDGMGSSILDKHLLKESFLQKNKVGDISSVFVKPFLKCYIKFF